MFLCHTWYLSWFHTLKGIFFSLVSHLCAFFPYGEIRLFFWFLISLCPFSVKMSRVFTEGSIFNDCIPERLATASSIEHSKSELKWKLNIKPQILPQVTIFPLSNGFDWKGEQVLRNHFLSSYSQTIQASILTFFGMATSPHQWSSEYPLKSTVLWGQRTERSRDPGKSISLLFPLL